MNTVCECCGECYDDDKCENCNGCNLCGDGCMYCGSCECYNFCFGQYGGNLPDLETTVFDKLMKRGDASAIMEALQMDCCPNRVGIDPDDLFRLLKSLKNHQ